MPRLFFPFFLSILMSIAVPVAAEDFHAGNVIVSNPWARATVGVSRPAAVYLTIHNTGETADELISVQTPIANRAEIHQNQMTGGMMKMTSIPALKVAAGKTVTLAPGGYHIMMTGLKEPLSEGAQFPLSLTFKSGRSVDITVPVKAIGASAGGQKHDSAH
jgi:copper(I)-binding protein